MTPLSWVVTILGLAASIIGASLAYMTFISPLTRFKWYLKRTEGWEEINSDLYGGGSFHRYKKHPEFTIEQPDDYREWERDEPWMKKLHKPNPHQGSRMVHLKVSGQLILSEEFIFMDEGRIFVPVPRVNYSEKEEDNEYYYTKIQELMARIIGRYYIYKNLDGFMKQAEIKIIEGKK